MNKERYKYTPDAQERIASFEPTHELHKSITAPKSLYTEQKYGFTVQTQRGELCQGVVTIDCRYEQDGRYVVENAVDTGANSHLRLVIYHHSAGNTQIRETLRLRVERGSRLEIVHVADTASSIVSDIYLTALGDSTTTVTVVDLNNKSLIRNQEILLTEPGAEFNVNGLYLTAEDDHVDNYVRIEHQVPHCTSNQLFKGVLSGRSSAAFTGHIHVAKGAMQTAAFQENHNILLSEKARINTRPWLEIYADDVKCNHGATVGRLDPEAIYYMRQRGISTDAARRLQITGFAEDVLRLENFGDLQDIIHQKIAHKLQ